LREEAGQPRGSGKKKKKKKKRKRGATTGGGERKPPPEARPGARAGKAKKQKSMKSVGHSVSEKLKRKEKGYSVKKKKSGLHAPKLRGNRKNTKRGGIDRQGECKKPDYMGKTVGRATKAKPHACRLKERNSA